MSSIIKSTHTIYIQSKNRTNGTTSNYDVILPEFITSDPMLQKFQVSLKDFTIYNSWYLVTTCADTITIDSTPYTIPHGTYTYQRLATIIQTTIGATVRWLQDQNKIQFTFSTPKTVLFDDIGTLLGFTPYKEYTGTTLTSENPMTPYEITHLYIHLNNIAPVEDNIDFSNMSGSMRPCSILGRVLINAAPFQLITYNQVLESDGILTADNSITKLEILITDQNGRELDFLPEHEMTIKIQVFDVEDTNAIDIVRELREVKDILKDMLTYKVLKKSV